ncbi:Stp1/IreP family PP2C-type Ser/Thr phosphatase [Bacillaceae bacterium W0354]
MEARFKSDIGKVRQVNEDSGGIYFNQANQMLAAIADGMGGHKAGDVASQLVSNFLKDLWEKTDKFTTEESIAHWLEQAIKETNTHVLEQAQHKEECIGMGTTVVVAVFFEDRAIVGHVGDSRLYYISEDEIIQITEDHSFVQELVKTGEITAEEAEAHPKKNVLLRAVGTEENINVDLNTFSIQSNSYILMCSDGLSNKLTTDEMLTTVRSDKNLEQKIDELIEIANKRGGEDNISVILVKCKREKVGEAS